MSTVKANITDIPTSILTGLPVFVRADFNVPLTNDIPPLVVDDSKIRATIPTIEYLVRAGARTVIASHLGRPTGGVDLAYSMENIAKTLEKLLGGGIPVKFARDSVGPETEEAVANLKNGEILVLENTRFHPEEEKNDPEYSAQLAKLGAIFVNDAFGSAHRAHASTAGITQYLPLSVAGFLLSKELKFLAGALYNPHRPLAALVGGKKVSTKINVLNTLLNKVDKLLIGGGMVFTFLKAQGKDVGKSYVEKDSLKLALEIIHSAVAKGVELVLAVDVVVADKISVDAKTKVVSVDEISGDWIGVDIGPATVELFAKHFAESKTIIWNGPPGIFEIKPFGSGTFGLVAAMSALTGTQASEEYPDGIITVACGGDTLAAVEACETSNFTHLSTGGGAALELLEGLALPGVEALTPLDSDAFRSFVKGEAP